MERIMERIGKISIANKAAMEILRVMLETNFTDNQRVFEIRFWPETREGEDGGT